MSIGSIQQISVWVDEMHPRSGAFARALELASRLGLPLRAVVPSADSLRRLPAEDRSAPDRPVAGLVTACQAACAERRVPMECAVLNGNVSESVAGFLRPSALCVFGSALADTAKVELVRQTLRAEHVPVFVCPQIPQPISRLLILHQAAELADSFLRPVAQLCGALHVAPVVLALAHKDREARALQDAAQDVWGELGLCADVDVVVGSEPRDALASVARWRRCSHVVVPRHAPAAWWRWLRGDSLGRLLGLADTIGLLALPARREPSKQTEKTAEVHSVAGA